MKRPRRERQHAWQAHIMGRKLVRRAEHFRDQLIEAAFGEFAIGRPGARLEQALFEDPRLKRLMGRA